MADKGLSAGLRAEYEAVYAYGLAGAQLSGDALKTAKDNQVAHRDRRDAVLVRLTESEADIPGAEAGYQLPEKVIDAESAKKLITAIEDSVTRQWRRALPETTGDDRRVAVTAFADSAVTQARWKRVLGESPSTTAFPGRE